MPFGFYIIMAAQFFSALADNALLIAAIAALREMHAPSAYEPLLKTFFTVSYVLLAAFVGIDPPFAAAERVHGRFIAITESRQLSDVERDLLRRAYEHVLG